MKIQNDTLKKSDIILVTILYIVVIIIFVMLVLSIKSQKKVVEESLNDSNDINYGSDYDTSIYDDYYDASEEEPIEDEIIEIPDDEIITDDSSNVEDLGDYITDEEN